MSETIKTPMSPEFLKLISAKAQEQEEQPIPKNMEFPLLDDMDMDVPLFGDYVFSQGDFPEDDSDVDMQCLLHINPSLGMSSLSL